MTRDQVRKAVRDIITDIAPDEDLSVIKDGENLRDQFDLDDDLLLETIEVAAFRVPVADDGPCVFTGRTAIYTGSQKQFDDGNGHALPRGIPMPVCDKTAEALAALHRDDVVVTPPTWHHAGGGCC